MSRSRELINRFLQHGQVFSWGYACDELLTVFDRTISLSLHKPFSMRIMHHKERYIMTWAKQFFHTEIEAYQYRNPAAAKPSPQAPIWVCWLQGFDKAPELAKLLVAQIEKQANGHPIHHISLDNYKQYVELPHHVVSKYERGRMPQQQFADVLRAALLAQHGGLWVDTSMYITQTIPEEVFTTPIFNVKDIRPSRTREAVACDFTKWQAYFIASHPGSVTYSFRYRGSPSMETSQRPAMALCTSEKMYALMSARDVQAMYMPPSFRRTFTVMSELARTFSSVIGPIVS